MFAVLGAKVIDADKINHALIQRDGACFKKIVRVFGKRVVAKGGLDRRALADIVFNDSRELKKLRRIVHPPIIREIKRRILQYRKSGKNFLIIVDAPLLIEAGLDGVCDVLAVVKAGKKAQTRRLLRRMKIEKKDIQKRLRAQMPLKDKLKLADIVIDNDGSLTKTKKEVKATWQKLQKKT